LTDPEVGCESLNQENLEWNLAQAEAFDASSLESIVAALYQDNCGGTVTALLTSSLPDQSNTDQLWFYFYIFTITDVCNNSVVCVVMYSGGVETQEPDDYIDLEQLQVNEGDDDICVGAKIGITVQNGLEVNGGSITLIAGHWIRLMPGVVVQSGGHLHAYLSETLCENPTPLLVSKETESMPDLRREPNIENGSFFMIYPNPTTGVFTLEITNAKETAETTIELYNIVGERLLDYMFFGSDKHEFNIGSLTRGIYIVRVLNGNKVGLEKVIKQ
jgi:hypothetical protein